MHESSARRYLWLQFIARRDRSAGVCEVAQWKRQNPPSWFQIQIDRSRRRVTESIVKVAGPVVAAPHDHLRAGPDGGVQGTRSGTAAGDWAKPGIGDWVVAAAVSQVIGLSIGAANPKASPDEHSVAGPDGGVILAAGRARVGRDRGPRVRERVEPGASGL